MSFDYRHYVPILKGKEGEYSALREAAPQSKAHVTPLIEVPDIPWDFINDVPAKTLDDHLARVPDKIANCWGNALPVFVDLPYLANGELLTGNIHPVDYIFDRLGQLGNFAVPVVGLSRETIYQDAIERVVAQYQRGACLRLEYEDFDEEGVLTGLIDEILAKLASIPQM